MKSTYVYYIYVLNICIVQIKTWSRESADAVELARGLGVGVEGQVVEELEVGVEHEARVRPVRQLIEGMVIGNIVHR
jgi:hypothetical protein